MVEVGVGSANSRFATPGFEELADLDNRMSDEEHIRLMYVATTRARDHLVLSMRRPAKGQRTTAAAISGYMVDNSDLWEAVELDETVAAEPQTDDAQAIDRTIDETLHSTEYLDKWVEARRRTINEFSRPLFVAATALNRAHKDKEAEQDSSEPWRRGRAGTSVGRAVHAVLQSIDLATGEDVEHRPAPRLSRRVSLTGKRRSLVWLASLWAAKSWAARWRPSGSGGKFRWRRRWATVRSTASSTCCLKSRAAWWSLTTRPTR